MRDAVATGRASSGSSPARRDALPSPDATQHAAILEPEDFGALFRVVGGCPGLPGLRSALRLAPHVFVRPEELHAEWAEIDLYAAGGAPRSIPGVKMTGDLDHGVPLSKQAIDMIVEVQSHSGRPQFVSRERDRISGPSTRMPRQRDAAQSWTRERERDGVRPSGDGCARLRSDRRHLGRPPNDDRSHPRTARERDRGLGRSISMASDPVSPRSSIRRQ